MALPIHFSFVNTATNKTELNWKLKRFAKAGWECFFSETAMWEKIFSPKREAPVITAGSGSHDTRWSLLSPDSAFTRAFLSRVFARSHWELRVQTKYDYATRCGD